MLYPLVFPCTKTMKPNINVFGINFGQYNSENLKIKVNMKCIVREVVFGVLKFFWRLKISVAELAFCLGHYCE